jgi:hypothetical protein
MMKRWGERRREREGKTVLSNVTFSQQRCREGQCDISPQITLKFSAQEINIPIAACIL